jgi:hypothetical protein
MSSTVTTSERPTSAPAEPVIVYSAETDASLDASEDVWLSADQFSRNRELGGWDRTKLQHAVGANAYGLKQSRRVRRFKTEQGRNSWEYVYARWRVRCWLGFRPDGTPPPRKVPRRRHPRYTADPIANHLASASGMSAEAVLAEVVKGRLQATLDPSLNFFLFLDESSAQEWLDKKQDDD